MSGAGVSAGRKKIEDAFTSIRSNIDTNTNLPEIEIVEEIELDAAPVTQESLRSLSEKAEPIMRATAHRHQGAVATTHHNAVDRKAIHHISVPRKSAEQLIAEAMKLLGGRK